MSATRVGPNVFVYGAVPDGFGVGLTAFNPHLPTTTGGHEHMTAEELLTEFQGAYSRPPAVP